MENNNGEKFRPYVVGGKRDPRIMGLLESAADIIDNSGGDAEILRQTTDEAEPQAVIWESDNGDSVTARGKVTDIMRGDRRIESIPTKLMRDYVAPKPDKANIDLKAYDYAGSTYYPRGSRFGWTRPFGSQEYRLHKGGTVAATLAASALLSIAATAGVAGDPDIDVPGYIPHLTWTSSGVNERIVIDNESRQVIGPQMVLRKQTTERLPGPAEIPDLYVSTDNLMQMNIAPNFKLNSEKTRAIDQEKLTESLDAIERFIEDGYEIKSVTVTGLASDETALDAQMGIGAPDPENVQLSADRAKLVRNVLVSSLAKRDILVDPDQITIRNEERVLSGTDAADASRLLDKYRNSDEPLSAAETKRLAELLDQQRGGLAEFTLEKPGQDAEVRFKTTKVEECVIDERRDVTYHIERDPYNDDHTIVLLVVPIPIVRRDKWPTEPQKYVTYTFDGPKDPPEEPVSKTVVAPKPPETPAQLKIERTPYKPRLTYAERIERTERYRKLRRIGAGALAVAAIVLVRGDVGYCPDPDDLQNQSFRWGDFPERLDLGLEVPFTDIETSKVPVFLDICPTDIPDVATPTQPPVEEQPCTTVKTLYENGELVATRTETDPKATVTTVTVSP